MSGHHHAHDAAHDHGPGHDDHEHGLEGYHVHGGAPALDIGGDIGAMVVTLDAGAIGTELHLRSEHEPPIDIHTGVWKRDLGGGQVVAAVFAELLEGTYLVLDEARAPVRRVEIHGGRVTELDLRG